MRGWAFVFLAVTYSSGLSAAPSKKSCGEDQAKFCDGKFNRQCLMTRINELSTDCRAFLESNSVGKVMGVKNKAVGSVNDTKAACSTEITQLCASATLVGGGYMKCLKQNYDKLSDGCKNAVDQAKSGK